MNNRNNKAATNHLQLLEIDPPPTAQPPDGLSETEWANLCISGSTTGASQSSFYKQLMLDILSMLGIYKRNG